MYVRVPGEREGLVQLAALPVLRRIVNPSESKGARRDGKRQLTACAVISVTVRTAIVYNTARKTVIIPAGRYTCVAAVIVFLASSGGPRSTPETATR